MAAKLGSLVAWLAYAPTHPWCIAFMACTIRNMGLSYVPSLWGSRELWRSTPTGSSMYPVLSVKPASRWVC